MAVVEIEAWSRYVCRSCGWAKRVTEAGRHALIAADHLCDGRHWRDPDVQTVDYVIVSIVRSQAMDAIYEEQRDVWSSSWN